MYSSTRAVIGIAAMLVTGTLMSEVSAPLVIDKEHTTISAVTASEIHHLTSGAPSICSDHYIAERELACSHLHRDLTYMDAQGVTGPYLVRFLALLVFAALFLSSCLRLPTMRAIAVSYLLYGPLAVLVPDLIERASYAGYLTPLWPISGF